MTSQTRNRMVKGAVDLIRRRGVNGTSVRDVVQHTGTPRGSIGHHFPGGKPQIIEEALLLAGREVSEALEPLLRERGVVSGLRAFIGWWRKVLEGSRFEAGCPVLVTSVEQYTSEGKDPRKNADAQVQKHLLDLASDIFADWQKLLAAALQREGLSSARSRRLATLIVASVEGTVAMCRACQSAQPLEDIRQELEGLLTAALETGSTKSQNR